MIERTDLSIGTMLADMLPADQRALLRDAAAARCLNTFLADDLTGSPARGRQLLAHPLVEARSSVRGTIYTIDETVRRALLADAAEPFAQLAASSVSDAPPHEVLYGRLANDVSRREALAELEVRFEAAVTRSDVPSAHELLQLLTAWPVSDDPDAIALERRLRPKLTRYGRTARDRDVTARYFERAFESNLITMLFDAAPIAGTSHRPWILEMHAPGGRGKTMFLKHLFADYCPPRDIPVARIDFDFVANVTLATQEPVRLLLAIADQLSGQLPGSPLDAMVENNRAHVARLYHEALPISPTQRATPGTSARGGAEIDRAAAIVPQQFGREFRVAHGDQTWLVVIDTVENVLHTPGADIMPLLELLDGIRRGDSDHVPGLAGLRVIVSGRFDLSGRRELAGGTATPRCAGFEQRWVGSDVAMKPLRSVGPEPVAVWIGHDAAMVELPEFTEEEARRFLSELRGVEDPDVVDAIVERVHDNPMKLALLAEHVQQHGVSADVIREFELVELFYLVDRVVDRIADGRVQWLLRWGSLMQVLTRDAVEVVIWPALVRFAESEHAREQRVESAGLGEARPVYDDVEQDGIGHRRPDADRWVVPTPDEVRPDASRDSAWQALLEYAAAASWVSRTDASGDAVVFHNEIQAPMRSLLRRKDQPVYNDINRRAVEYWEQELATATEGIRRVAIANLVFHLYEPWSPASREPPDTAWLRLLESNLASRADRESLSYALLKVAGRAVDDERPTDVVTPSDAVIARAHLEAAEALIASAGSGTPDELPLHAERSGLPPEFEATEPRRCMFLGAVYEDAVDNLDGAWALLERMLTASPADDQHHLALVAAWVTDRTPPRERLDVAHRLAEAAADTPLYGMVAPPYIRGLQAAERWTEALEAAAVADDAHLMAVSMLAMGRADEVLDGLACTDLDRARAALQQCRPQAALDLIADAAPPSKIAPWHDDETLVVTGQARAMLDQLDDAVSDFGTAAQRAQPSSSASWEAGLAIGRANVDLDAATSVLGRYVDDADPVVRLRVLMGEVHASVRAVGVAPARFADLDDATDAIVWLPPSVAAAVETTRLAVDGPSSVRLAALADAMGLIDGAGARLLALDGIDNVGTPDVPLDDDLVERLLALTTIGPDMSVAVVLARAELERVLGRFTTAEERLAELEARDHDEPDVLRRQVAAVRERLPSADAAPRSPEWDFRSPVATPPRSDIAWTAAGSPSPEPRPAPGPSLIDLATSRKGGFRVEVEVDPSDANEFAAGPAERGFFALLESPRELYEHLGQGFGRDSIELRREESADRFLHLRVRDDGAASWPWELATHGGRQLGPMIRRRGVTGPGDEALRTPYVHVEVIGDQSLWRSSGGRLDPWGMWGEVPHRDVSFAPAPLESIGPEAGVIHLLAQPVDSRSGPALWSGEQERLAPEHLATVLGGVRLLILDLVLDDADTFAAEQIMIALRFCWHLQRHMPGAHILCGVFADRRVDAGRGVQLARAVAEARLVAELVTAFQVDRPRIHPFREVVAYHSDNLALRVVVDP